MIVSPTAMNSSLCDALSPGLENFNADLSAGLFQEQDIHVVLRRRCI